MSTELSCVDSPETRDLPRWYLDTHACRKVQSPKATVCYHKRGTAKNKAADGEVVHADGVVCLFLIFVFNTRNRLLMMMLIKGDTERIYTLDVCL
jgi:hypothetical protein